MDQFILLLLIVLFLAVPIWQIMKQNKQVRNIRDMQSKLVPGAEVITGSGMHGVVVDTSDTTVDLIIADGIVTRWEKAAIARNLSEGTGADYAHRDQRASHADNADATGEDSSTNASEDSANPGEQPGETTDK
ncbi:MAG: preprotein translocase subunit YajC [Corynebacterium sp.]|uniref:preprotein translocase subunit YajC n=1 Tax=Corynebacterium sp. TaxID=1720 RepID=UPI0026DD4866|nr:preprotein translocase subunit YajC [Corynebacterium sp.]MDO5029153.1 preprotein translocase subunit YajC [Corynebacterium sp.]